MTWLRWAGWRAAEVLESGVPLTVLGATSRGRFLAAGRQVIFLSLEPFRGPLTVNVTRLEVPVSVPPSSVWRAPAPLLPLSGVGARRARLSWLGAVPSVPSWSSLGRGEGLTPSEDDVLLGWLLARARWLGEAVSLPAEAWERTTLLSANLLEMACAGEADERLLALVDHVASGTPLTDDWRGWGATSAVAALSGMAAALG